MWTIKEDSVLAGAEYSAVLHLTVPLRFLLKDGAVSQNPSAVPESEWKYGGWVPRAKSWREMGVDLDEMPEGTSATHIGPMLRSQYLPFLKAVRTAVEAGGTVHDRIESLRGVLRDKAFAGFVRKHGGQGKIVDIFFPPLVQSIPGINGAVASALAAARITTVRQLRKKTDKELLAVKGLGPGALQKLRAFAAAYVSDDSAERIDAVLR